MAPLRGDLRQRAHDEAPLVGPGVRHDQGLGRADQVGIGHQVQVQRPRSIGPVPDPSGLLLHGVQVPQDLGGRQQRLDKRDSVQVSRLRRVRPRPPSATATSADDRQAVVLETVQRIFQQRLDRGIRTLEIAA
jgi:hypothetical protein